MIFVSMTEAVRSGGGCKIDLDYREQELAQASVVMVTGLEVPGEQFLH